MPYDFNIGGQGALSGALSGAALGGPLAPFTAAGGGILGALGGIRQKQEVPEFNAADTARNYLERFGGFGQEQGQIEANTDTVKRRTVAELISQGVDPVAARQMGEQKATEFRTRSMSDLLNAAQAREAGLTQQLLPQQLQREEDIASMRNLERAQAQEAAMSWGPTLAGATMFGNELGLFGGGQGTGSSTEGNTATSLQTGLQYDNMPYMREARQQTPYRPANWPW